ncbi:glycosyltransferase [Euzebya tangerina]|uniref:glycosyltransferase n=1 Tax=Euzebya tangerina TaxID=591198 RepID=UPI000E311374|nr:glycosyltransferase [Euzebya tangerina]
MRVAHVIARLNVGGPAAILQTLVEESARAGSDVDHVVLAGTPGEGEASWHDVRGGELDVRLISGLRPDIRPPQDMQALAHLVRHLRSIRPDIVHTHTAKGGLLGRLAARRVPLAKTVHTFHGHVLHGYFGRGSTRAYVALERRLARRTDGLIGVGERVRSELLEAGIGQADRFWSVAPGVTAPDLVRREEAREQLGLAADAPVVCMVGRLTQIKRVDRALAVLRELRSRDVRPVLLVAGGGDLEETMRAQAADLGDQVRFLGWVRDVGTVMGASDLILLTSDNEGMPVGLIEAALVGLPAVATDVGGVSEVVLDGKSGRVVPATVQDLADAIEDLVMDRGRLSTMAEVAKRHGSACFGADILIRRHHEIYREVLA